MERRIIIPDIWMGESVDGAMETALKNVANSPPDTLGDKPQTATPANANIPNKERYIILPGAKHGNYEYPDFLVGMDRTHHNENWQQCFDALKNEGAFMINLRQYADFLNLLRSGKAHDGNGDLISQARLDEVYEDITKVRDPWRSEWIDAKFDKIIVGRTALVIPKTQMQITYHSLDKTGNYVEYKEPIEDCLMSNKTLGISLETWLGTANNQGLPPSNILEGKLYYWAPANGRVARFNANSDWAVLNCDGDPSYSDPALGVRACRAKN